MGKITFITGGARSGKSALALSLASRLTGRKAFIATCEPLDDEMRERIKRHKEERPGGWDTFEEPVHIAGLIGDIGGRYEVAVIDCLTLWLSNMLHKEADIEAETEKLVLAMKDFPCGIFIVSNEVGMGIVPENELGRAFRDMAGILNRKIAGEADEAYITVSGIPVKIKGE